MCQSTYLPSSLHGASTRKRFPFLQTHCAAVWPHRMFDVTATMRLQYIAVSHWDSNTSFPYAGIDVEVVVPAEAAGPRIAAVDDLTPQQLFTLYADQQNLLPEAAAVGCV